MKRKQIFDRNFVEVTGCIHNHSIYSYDGLISMARIIREAKLRDLDYVTINDHNTKAAAEDEHVLKEKDLVVIVGMEVNDPNKDHHYLVFNSDEVLKGKEVQEYVEFYKNSGAIGFAAHPIERRICSRFRKYEWLQKDVDGFDGIEIWNYLSEWIGKMKPKLNGLFLVLFPAMFVRKPFREVLNWWDQLNAAGKKKSAIGSVDAHTERMKKFGINFKFLRHRTLYNAIRTNVFLESGKEINKANILTALQKGNSYIINYKMGNPYNFFAGISNRETNAILGEEIKFRKGLKYYFRIPKIAKVTLFQNGEKVEYKRDENGSFEITKPGNYRLEITRFGRGWIYTNNIYVID
ncbi:MAG: PHP domain-containing protein [Candidatus Cloacimonetes bacterium]|nr:PHP domain-containing protein [Candidatus Cloacimonadota bacterium]MCF7813280.1 PHP domain-containing protein [Candidatus Cloacimonadota bacterium]MCF7867355.1 PHP domain-containing protein [Candidatus Cloacimonadota bacterium]MCF7882789.1 PHP domain-containing protein [Candidatus Cloacimonadota bacterium]